MKTWVPFVFAFCVATAVKATAQITFTGNVSGAGPSDSLYTPAPASMADANYAGIYITPDTAVYSPANLTAATVPVLPTDVSIPNASNDSSRPTYVPEPPAIIAALGILLPLGISALRIFRQRQMA
jgi:hypothetical protein